MRGIGGDQQLGSYVRSTIRGANSFLFDHFTNAQET